VNSHIYIFRTGENNLTERDITDLDLFLSRQQEVAVTSQIIMSEAMISNGKKIKGCLLRGIDWQQEVLPTQYRDYVFKGDYRLEDFNSAVLGYRLANRLGLSVGDTFTIHSPMNSKVTPLGLRTEDRTFLLTGLYKSGMYEYDSKFLFCSLESAMEFKGTDEYSMLEVKLFDEAIENADYLAYKWEQELMQVDFLYQFSSWIDFNGNLFSLLQLQKWVLFIILSFLILIASFNVVSSVSTSIIEKRKELGILKAYGASNNLLRKIFVNKALITGLIAILTGLILGYGIAEVLSRQSVFLLNADVYFFDRIQVQFSWLSMVSVLIVSLIIILLASLIPLKQISRMEVTSILRKN
ncbi:ABC transporter permease, partial [Candidatus Cloacimonadota bacterium]